MSTLSKRFKFYLSNMASAVLSTRPAARELTVAPYDVFIVSYLRSGSTWARFLFGNLLQDEPVTFSNVDRIVPMIYDFPDRVLRRLPRLLKSHECFDPRYPQVVHIVRDPRDVAVSFYHYNRKVGVLADNYPIEAFVPAFLAGKTVDYADRLGSWEDHTLSWILMRRGNPSYRLLRYEDLLADPIGELVKTIPLLPKSLGRERIEQAVRLSSAERMRSLERQQSNQWRTTRNTRKDIAFIREARSGTWREQLSQHSVRQIEQSWGSTMQQLGYELSSIREEAVAVAPEGGANCERSLDCQELD